MGDTNADDLPRVVSAADSLAYAAPFEAELAGTGTFPRRAPPRVYWVGVRAAALAPLREILDRALAAHGIVGEKRTFSPHLTVGRKRSGRSAGIGPRAGDAFGNLAPDGLVFTVGAVHLVKSDLFPEGPRYANVHEVILGCRKT